MCGLGVGNRGRVWTGCRKQRACVNWVHDTEGWGGFVQIWLKAMGVLGPVQN